MFKFSIIKLYKLVQLDLTLSVGLINWNCKNEEKPLKSWILTTSNQDLTEVFFKLSLKCLYFIKQFMLHV